MNNKILEKAIKELRQEKPNIPYVLGMLETMSEISAPVITTTSQIHLPTSVTGTTPTDEGSILDAAAKSKLQEVMASTKYE